jgi:hypothetical protein
MSAAKSGASLAVESRIALRSIRATASAKPA